MRWSLLHILLDLRCLDVTPPFCRTAATVNYWRDFTHPMIAAMVRRPDRTPVAVILDAHVAAS
jgi:hypothetical protein